MNTVGIRLQGSCKAAGDLDTGLGRICGLLEFCNDLVRDTKPGDIIVNVSCHGSRLEKQNAGNNLYPERCNRFIKTGHLLRSENSLSLKESRPCRRFLPQFEKRQFKRLCFRSCCSARKKGRGAVELLPGQVKTAFQDFQSIQQLYGVKIEYRLPLLVVAERYMIAGKNKYIPYPECSGSKKITLQGQTVPAPASDL